MRTVNLSLLMMAYVTASGAQQSQAISFGPLPGVVAGSPVPLNSSQFVFVGPNIRQLTISYPSELAGIPAADRITFAIEKLDQVRPTISSSVTIGAGGVYNYGYTIYNDATAPAKIKVWSLSLPASDGAVSVSHREWTTSQDAASPVAAPAAGLVGITPIALVSWHAPANAAAAPNSTVSGFELVSHYRPGLTFIYARSDEDYAVPATLPSEVNSQLDVMRQRDWMNKRVVGIGPRFPKDWTRDVIAADFKDGVARLIQSGDLDGASKFVVALNTSLDTVINSHGAAIPFAGVITAAESQLEKNIANAIAISLE